ncbi:MAG: sugar transferase [Rhizobiaceae bacterium]
MTTYLAFKRLIDVAFCLFTIVVFGWLLALVWLAVKLTSRGPGIFAQQRVGKEQVVFTCYKFRTMTVGTAQIATHEVASSSVTKVGRLLRASKLDELPQIMNLMKGEMSLVGPRPCLPNQTELVEERERRGVYALQPGITGIAQVNGIDMSDPVRLATVDAQYALDRSIALDIRLLLATFLGKGWGDKVVVRNERTD